MTQTEQPAGLAAMINTGYSRVLLVRAGWLICNKTSKRDTLPVLLRSMSLVASVPIMVEFILLLARTDWALHTPTAFAWVVALSVTDMAALMFAWWTWGSLSRAGHSLDELLINWHGKDRLVCWIDEKLSPGRQMLWSTLWSAIGCLLLWFTQPAIEARLEMGPVSYFAVAWSAAIGGNCIYWIVVLSELARRILHRPELNLVWHSPSSTPGLMLLSDAFGVLTLAVLVAFFVLEVLALRASRYGPSPVLLTLTNVIPIATAVTALLAGIIPHMWLYLAVRDARRSTLAKLRRLIDDAPPSTIDGIEQLQARIELYRLVETSPGLPFNTTAMVQYGAAVLGTLLAFFLGR